MLLPCLLAEYCMVSLVSTQSFSSPSAKKCCEYSEKTQVAEFLHFTGKQNSNVDFTVLDICVFELFSVC